MDTGCLDTLTNIPRNRIITNRIRTILVGYFFGCFYSSHPVQFPSHSRPIQPQSQIPCLVIFRWSDHPIPRPSPDSCCRPSAAKEGMHRSMHVMHVSCANLKKHFAEQFLEANHPQVPQCPGFHLAGRLLDSRIRIRYLIFAPTRVLLPGWSNNSN